MPEYSLASEYLGYDHFTIVQMLGRLNNTYCNEQENFMKYSEGKLIIQIKDLENTADTLGLDSLDQLRSVDIYQHLNRLTALFEDIGIPYDEMQGFYDDIAAGLSEEYQRLPLENKYPEMTLSNYDRWFRDILEATHIAHSNFHEQQLANLQALETSSAAFVKKMHRSES